MRRASSMVYSIFLLIELLLQYHFYFREYFENISNQNIIRFIILRICKIISSTACKVIWTTLKIIYYNDHEYYSRIKRI